MQGPLYEGRTILEAVQKATGRRERLALRRKMRGDVDVFANPNCNQILRNLRKAEQEASIARVKLEIERSELREQGNELARLSRQIGDSVTERAVSALLSGLPFGLTRNPSAAITGLLDVAVGLQEIAERLEASDIRRRLQNIRREVGNVEDKLAAAELDQNRALAALDEHDCRL